MNVEDTDLDLLDDCIAHWNRLAANPVLCVYLGEEPSAIQCALCQRYYEAQDCFGCPIRSYTGGALCTKTPFHGAYSEYHRLRDLLRDSEDTTTDQRRVLNFLSIQKRVGIFVTRGAMPMFMLLNTIRKWLQDKQNTQEPAPVPTVDNGPGSWQSL